MAKRKRKQKGEPIVYAALDRDIAERSLAPELLRRAKQGKCDGCGKSVIMVGAHLAKVKQACKRARRELQILCNGCADAQMEDCFEDRREFGIMQLPMTAEASRIQDRFELEMN